MDKLKEHKNYNYIKAFKRLHGRELMEEYNAHAIGIGWKKNETNAKVVPAIIFYIDSKCRLKSKFPTHFTFTSKAKSKEVQIPIKVIVSENASSEEN